MTIKEDAPLNMTGAAIAGTVGDTVVKGPQPPIFRRKKIAGIECYEISNEDFHNFQIKKRQKKLSEAEITELFGNGPILIENEMNGKLLALRYGNKNGNNKS